MLLSAAVSFLSPTAAAHYVAEKMDCLADTFANQGRVILRRAAGSSTVALQRFRGHFGVPPLGCARICSTVQHPSRSVPNNLLMALLFLKMYGTEHQHATICNVDEKTFRKLAWFYVKQMSSLRVVIAHFL